MHPLLLLQHRPLAGFSPKKCSSAKPGSASDLVSSTNPLAASQVRREPGSAPDHAGMYTLDALRLPCSTLPTPVASE